MGELVEAAKALSAPATKLIEVVSRGIGRAYDPRYKRKMADAAAYEIDTIAGAIRRNGDVPTLFDREGIQLDARSTQDLIERTGMRLFSQEVRKQQNIEAIVDKAYEELKNSEVVSDEPVDDDWIVRFFNSVEDVSNEKLQEIWARILAGEIKKPNSFPMRTLDIVRNLSCEEATLFETLSFCVLRTIDSAFIFRDEGFWRKFEISNRAIFILSEAGIINLSPHNLNFNFQIEPELIFNDAILGDIRRANSEDELSVLLDIHSLTESGKLLLNITNKDQELSESFALLFFEKLKNTHNGIKVSAHKKISETIDDIRCEAKDLLI